MSSDFVGECKAQFPADGEWLEGHEKVFINGEPLAVAQMQYHVQLRRMCNDLAFGTAGIGGKRYGACLSGSFHSTSL